VVYFLISKIYHNLEGHPRGEWKVSQNSDKEKDSNEEEDGTDMSHIEEKIVAGLNKAELTTRLSQGDEGQLLKVVKRKETHVEDDEQHCDGVLEECQVQVKLLECLLKEPEHKDVIAVSVGEVSQALIEAEIYATFQVQVALDSTEERMDEYITAVRELEDNLLLESKFEVQRQQLDIAEGDVFIGIKDVWVAKENNQQLGDECAELK